MSEPESGSPRFDQIPDEPPESTALSAVPARRFTVSERIVLTYRHHGGASLAFRILTYPLRLTPLKRFLRPRGGANRDLRAAARRWYAAEGRPVAIVIPSYRDARHLTELVASLRQTTDPSRVRIIVCDDASGPDHLATLEQIGGLEIVAGERNVGFAGNANRGIRAAGASEDVVILNSDIIAEPGWLESLQYATVEVPEAGIVGAKLIYPDGRIQFGGTVRNLEAPEWFDHRYRMRSSDWGPANVAGPMLAVSGACMYLTRDLINNVGLFDENYPMAYEDVDLCLRGWQAGFRTLYWPAAELRHLESVTRGTQVGERERTSQDVFWRRWREFFDDRNVRSASGALRIIYVTENTGVGGGHRVVFEHLNGLHDRGHNVELWTLTEGPDWFALKPPVRTFADYRALTHALAPVTAIKVATWWRTAPAVWEASLLNGIPVYFVQDIETSYYPANPSLRNRVLASYRPEFRYLTTSSWNRERLREFGFEAALVPPGIDLETFRPLPSVVRKDTMILALGRSNDLKNLPLTIRAWQRLPKPRPELILFGTEPEVAAERGIRYVTAPSDPEVNELLNQATLFVQTSVHEGFCLPPLESMATGGAVVCTDAHGNRDYCVDGENCLMPEASVNEVSAATARLLADAELRRRLGEAGKATAAAYSWAAQLDELERFFLGLAEPGRVVPRSGAVPHRPVTLGPS